MAQAVVMGPPLSPRETRRSGRRSIPSASASTSKSPDSDPPPKQKDVLHRPPLTSSNSGSRQKRLKQEDLEESVDDRKNGSTPSTGSTGSLQSNVTGRMKRKPKDKDKQLVVEVVSACDPSDPAENPPTNVLEEEEQGITRCVCGSTGEDDPDAGEFMVQCETCKVWQHGLCMGFESEDQLHDDDYYCEECKPELHTELLRKRSKRHRQSSAASHHNPSSTTLRLSRSHSPSTLLKQPSKRRNTMNSRDAAFDESLKEIIEATAAEAAAAHDAVSVTSTGNHDGAQAPHDDIDLGPNSRKKRKRAEDDIAAKKRTRSTSTASDHQGSIAVQDDTLVQSKATHTSAPTSKPSVRTNKRGGRKAAAYPDPQMALDGEDGVKRPGNNNRTKNCNPKRPPASQLSAHHVTQEQGSRRNQMNAIAGQNTSSNAPELSRPYRNSHAYAVSQQSFYTSWNLPDYLAHLEPMLPTHIPQPLEVRSGVSDNLDLTVERGVKVKWPSKRMSVGDMNKRVRTLVEWVGREQATALDRMRRRDALSASLREPTKSQGKNQESEGSSIDVMESTTRLTGPGVESPPQAAPCAENIVQMGTASIAAPAHEPNDVQSSATMKMMEELMEELIGFQERFGPGARSRERRLVSS